MKTASELRAQAQRWREVIETVRDSDVARMIRELIEELESRARNLEDDA